MSFTDIINDQSMFVNETTTMYMQRKPGYTSHPEPADQERAVPETKQPQPTNKPIRKTDPSHRSFDEEE